MLCFAGPKVPWKMDGEGRPREGFGNTFGWRRIMPGSARGVAVASGVVFPTWSAPFLKGTSHESSVSHLPLSDLEGKFWKVSHQSFVFAFSTFRFLRAKASFSHLQLSVFKSLEEGFSTFSMVCACLNPPPCIKGAFFFPSSKVLVSQCFPAVFLENFPIFEGFLRAKCFPTVKARAQGCKINK